MASNTISESGTTQTFYTDVITGLSAKKKYLPAKYFYDAKGDKLFQQIMSCPEYYLTRCEMEIFQEQTNGLVSAVSGSGEPFDLIELGVGDGTKTIHLLRSLMEQPIPFYYMPIDISGNILKEIEIRMLHELPDLNIKCLEGEYLMMVHHAMLLSDRPKVLMFLGSNIGNMTLEEALVFCKNLRMNMRKDDILIIGFDLMKNPATIRAAYDDKGGIIGRIDYEMSDRKASLEK
ncbi:L-histidine N(alpha)-methyltransferase [Pedobacter sp. AW31-3R]|uniref:L-histidine N(alpha)-methyltransferase n=1 Tax=Pedobacter sp. AW31-3R TaxID=3445781 RepID=UPI003F9F8811